MDLIKKMGVWAVALTVTTLAGAGPMDRITGADTRIQYSDHLTLVKTATNGVYFDRIKDSPGRGFRWSSPGTRARFKTNAAQVTVHLRYTDRHLEGSVRNGIGFYRIDGVANPSWKFDRPAGPVPGNSDLDLALPASNGTTMHEYEVVLPYADSLEFNGVSVTAGATWSTPTPRPTKRYVAFGDSVTQGFTASDVLHTYPFIAAEARNWQLINAGYGGRGAMASDGDFLAGIDAQVYSIAIGVNNWQSGSELTTFRTEMTGLLQRLRQGRPLARIYVITPLWVPPSWVPAQAKYPLEQYRVVIKEVVAARNDPLITLVCGPSLIDPKVTLFDSVAVHPNDAGFAQMGMRLSKMMQ